MNKIKSWILQKEYGNYLNILVVVLIATIGIILLTNGIEKTDDGSRKSDVSRKSRQINKSIDFNNFIEKKTILTLARDRDYRIGGEELLGPNCFFVENDSTV